MANSRKRVGVRGSVTSEANVGTVVVELEMENLPRKGWIRRVRADVTAGTNILNVSASIRESAGGTGLAEILAYALAAEPVDSEEDIYYEATVSDITLGTGSLFIGVAVDDATLDHVVAVQLDIEPAI